MKVLITGAAGFIGGHVVEQLAAQHELYTLTRQSLTLPDIHSIAHDLTQPLDYADLPPSIDAVIHLAQSAHYRDFPARAADIYTVNVHSTFALLEYARQAGARQFVFASTGSVYQLQAAPLTENDPVAPNGFYPASKLAAEALIGGYHGVFNTTICRLFFPYGTRQNPSMLIPRLVRVVHSGDVITLQGDEGLRLTPTHISDVVRALAAAVTLEGAHVINVAGDEHLSLREVGERIGRCVGREPVFQQQPDQQPPTITADNARMKTLLGAPRVRFAEGIDDLWRKI